MSIHVSRTIAGDIILYVDERNNVQRTGKILERAGHYLIYKWDDSDDLLVVDGIDLPEQYRLEKSHRVNVIPVFSDASPGKIMINDRTLVTAYDLGYSRDCDWKLEKSNALLQRIAEIVKSEYV